MSVKYITWAFEVEGLTPTQRVILLALSDWANDDGECYPGQLSVAEKSGVSESTVRRALNQMEAGGLLAREERRRPDGYRTSDKYTLNRKVTRLRRPSPVKSTGRTSPVISPDLTGQIDTPHRSPMTAYEPSVEPPVEPSVQQPRGRATNSQRAMIRDLYKASGRWVTDEIEAEWAGYSIAEADSEIKRLRHERRSHYASTES